MSESNDIMTTNVFPLSSESSPAVRRVAPAEARMIRRVEIDAADVARDWYRGPNALRGEINSLDHNLREILEQNATLHEQHHAYGFEVFHPKFAPALYWVLLGLAAVLETPLNNSALGLLQMDDLETLMLAGSLGVLNVLGASFVGWKLRQLPWHLSALRDWLFMLVMVVVALATMFGLAGMRMDDLLLKAKDVGLPVSSTTFTTFVAIQLLFFAVGSFFSYSMHPADAKLERLLKHKLRLRQRADALLQQRARLAARHDRALGLAQAALRKLHADCLTSIAEYREYNLATRTNTAPLWLRGPLDESVFAPLDLGSALDPTPASFDELVRASEQQARAALGS